MADYRHPLEVAAMLFVLGGFVVIFAVGSTWMTMKGTSGLLRFVWALKIAVGLKIATLVGAAAHWVMWMGWLPKIMGWLVLLVWPDLLMGLCSVELVGLLGEMCESTDIALLNSFLFTGLTTLFQGMFLNVWLMLIALVVLGIKGACRWTKRGQFSPASV